MRRWAARASGMARWPALVLLAVAVACGGAAAAAVNVSTAREMWTALQEAQEVVQLTSNVDATEPLSAKTFDWIFQVKAGTKAVVGKCPGPTSMCDVTTPIARTDEGWYSGYGSVFEMSEWSGDGTPHVLFHNLRILIVRTRNLAGTIFHLMDRSRVWITNVEVKSSEPLPGAGILLNQDSSSYEHVTFSESWNTAMLYVADSIIADLFARANPAVHLRDKSTAAFIRTTFVNNTIIQQGQGFFFVDGSRKCGVDKLRLVDVEFECNRGSESTSAPMVASWSDGSSDCPGGRSSGMWPRWADLDMVQAGEAFCQTGCAADCTNNEGPFLNGQEVEVQASRLAAGLEAAPPPPPPPADCIVVDDVCTQLDEYEDDYGGYWDGDRGSFPVVTVILIIATVIALGILLWLSACPPWRRKKQDLQTTQS